MTSPSFGKRAMVVLWPAFLMATVLEGLVFALVDPALLHGWRGAPLSWSDTAVYSLAFFVFWGSIAAAGAMTEWLARGADDVKRPAWPSGSAGHASGEAG